MSTPSLTFLKKEGCDENIICLYRHSDGYPSGHGLELANFLEDITIVNGIPLTNSGNMANRAECLAAQLVCHFKEGVGDFYLYPTSTKDVGQDYIYEITVPDVCKKPFAINRYNFVVKDFGNKKIFEGGFDQFKTFCENN